MAVGSSDAVITGNRWWEERSKPGLSAYNQGQLDECFVRPEEKQVRNAQYGTAVRQLV
jgi:hypothetical protein